MPSGDSAKERVNAGQRQRHAARVASGFCSRCGKAPPEPGLKMCGSCGEKRRAADKARRARARQEGKLYAGRDPLKCRRSDRAGDRRRRRARREAGLCSKCGRNPPADGRSVCEGCGEARKHAAYYTSIIPLGFGAGFGFRHGPHRLACLVGGGSGISNRYSGLSL